MQFQIFFADFQNISIPTALMIEMGIKLIKFLDVLWGPEVSDAVNGDVIKRI